MVDKGKLEYDPRGLIFEAYRMEGISEAECRSIFFDWALGTELGADTGAMIDGFLAEYAVHAPDHPMSAVLREGREKTLRPVGGGQVRRGGRAGRIPR